jgi:molecular chaperone GrpE
MSEINEEKVQEPKENITKEANIEASDLNTEKPTAEDKAKEDQSEQNPESDKKTKKKRSFLGQKNNDHAEEIEKLKQEKGEWNDKYLRIVAEFDNYKKRTLKEKTELLKYGGEAVLQGILPVVDDFERARKSISEASDLDAVKAGIELIYNKFAEFISQQGIKEIEAQNLDLNTDFHEAITRFPAPTEEMKGKIIDVVQKGYLLHDKVMRFAKVVVGE